MFLLTRKEDVKMFRVRKLLSLIQGRVGPQPCLLGLLTIYKLYYPNLVAFALPPSNKMFFGSYDRKWRCQVREMVEKSEARQALSASSSLGGNAAELGLSKSRQLAIQAPAKKRRRLEIPISHSASAETQLSESMEQVSLSVNTKKVPFVRVDTFMNLIDNVEKIEFPSQIAACLRDPILQHLMAYAADRVVTARFTFWLQHTLTDEFLNHSSVNVEENERLLRMLVDFTDFLQEGVPVVDSFISSYLHTWNGMDYGPFILRLISKCQMYPFSDLNDLILEPLRQLYFSSSVYFKCQCLLTLTELLRNYAAYECPRLKEWSAAVTAENNTTTILPTDPSLHSVFPERLNETVQPALVLQKLAAFVDRLAVLGLRMEGDNTLLLHSVVNFVELLSQWNQQHGVEKIILPSEHLLRRILFSDCSSAISRLCVAFCRYKESFVQSSSRQRESVSAFNDMLVDMCDALWRNKAFINPTQGSLKALSGELNPIVTSMGIPYPSSRFSIFQGQAFLPYAWSFLLQTQPEGKRVHPNQLKGVKDVYLEFLEQQNLAGVIRFINTFIMRKSVSGRKNFNVVIFSESTNSRGTKLGMLID
nr:hypothetical protein BaRGS_032733 [Batillaria attramentaria]